MLHTNLKKCAHTCVHTSVCTRQCAKKITVCVCVCVCTQMCVISNSDLEVKLLKALRIEYFVVVALMMNTD